MKEKDIVNAIVPILVQTVVKQRHTQPNDQTLRVESALTAKVT